MGYLTEERLGNYLVNIFPELEFIHDKAVPNSSNKRFRPDYRCEKLKLIVEFDGHHHYCDASRIITDIQKDLDYTNIGYKVYRIPYFVQLTSDLLFYIFGKQIQFQQQYPHGFIDKYATPPANFCELGVELFKSDLDRFSFCKDEILQSLRDKIEECGNPLQIVPKSMIHML